MKRKKPRFNDLTRRERSLLREIRAGMTISKAALAAGYSSKWHGQSGSQAYKNIQKKMPELPDELGLTYESIIKQLREANKARETNFNRRANLSEKSPNP
jgi:uncharacterized protein YukE